MISNTGNPIDLLRFALKSCARKILLSPQERCRSYLSTYKSALSV